MAFWRRGGLRARLLLAHLIVIAAGAVTLFVVTLVTAPTLHDRLMVAVLGPGHTVAQNPDMAVMEQATSAIFQTATQQALLLSGGAAVLVAVAVSLLISARIVTPVRQMLAASRRGTTPSGCPPRAPTSSPRWPRSLTRWPGSWRRLSGGASP